MVISATASSGRNWWSGDESMSEPIVSDEREKKIELFYLTHTGHCLFCRKETNQRSHSRHSVVSSAGFIVIPASVHCQEPLPVSRGNVPFLTQPSWSQDCKAKLKCYTITSGVQCVSETATILQPRQLLQKWLKIVFLVGVSSLKSECMCKISTG